MREIEPHVKGLKYIRVPQTGIDYVCFSEKMADKIVLLDAEIRLGERVSSILEVAGRSTTVACKTKAVTN
jgi:L-2-hydroxyglutarate oxidase